MPDAERAKIQAEIAAAAPSQIWVPNPGPQTDAYFCPADELLYGGQGGGGKSDLIAGLALTKHKNSLIMRRQYTDLGALIDRVLSVYGSRKGFNGQPPPKLRTTDGRLIEFGAAQKLGDEQHWQGQAHDLIALDEATQFLLTQVQFLLGWNRPRDEADVDQRCRAVLASNPPISAAGTWIIGRYRPWLDPTHSNPAEHGELRWFITDPEGDDLEVEGPAPVEMGGRTYIPKSRTFIPARLSDNPTLVRTGYQATLDALPEPLRSAIRDGNFMAAREDDVWQVIPTPWILAANERWRQGKPNNAAMTSIGLDVARGGRDSTVLSRRYGAYFDELIRIPGKQTPDGPSVVALVVQHMRDGAVVGLDSIGVGGSVQDHLKSSRIEHEPLNGAERSTMNTRDGKYGFATKRSEMWWMLREALDPDYGHDLALPPDTTLQAQLTAPTYEIRPGEPPKIYVQSKEDMKKAIGQSPDEGDAVVYAWASGGLFGRKNRSRILHAPPADNNYDELRH